MSNAQDNAAHTCSYSCDRPECIKAQRDELAAAAAQEAVVWQWRCPRADTDWSDCDKSLYDELRKAIGGEAGEMNGLRYEVRALYAAPVTAAPGIDILHRALVSIAKGCCHAQKVADDALAEFRIDASPKGDEPRTPIDGCTESNCPRCRTHPDHRGDMEHAGIGRRPPQDSPKGGSDAPKLEAALAVVAELIVDLRRIRDRATAHREDTDADRKRDLAHVERIATLALRRALPRSHSSDAEVRP